jgi:hypothetical protein
MSSYKAYNSQLNLLLSLTGPYLDLKNVFSKTARAFLLDVDNTHVSDAYVRTGLIHVLYNMILFLMKVHATLIGSLIHKNIYCLSKLFSYFPD